MATINISNGLVHSTGAYCLSAGSGGSHIMVHNDYVCVPTLCTGSTANFNDLIVSGNLTVHGTCSILNTTVCTTSAMSITNAGTGPALVVNQTGSQPVVNLQDDGTSVFYIEDGGNVGIGTTNPDGTLEIQKAQNTAPFDTPFIKLRPTTTTNSTGTTSITLGTSTLDDFGFSISGWRALTDGTPYLRIKSHYNDATGSDVMTMTNAGNVGIGTTSPKTYAHIGKFSGGTAAAQEVLRLTGDYTSLFSGPQIVFTNQHDSGTCPNTGEYNLAGIYAYDSDQSWGGGIRFQTSAGTGSGGSALLDRMTINHAGNVGIGTTDPGTAYKLLVNGTCSYLGTYADVSATSGAFRFYDGVTFRGGLGTDAWAHSGSSSDITLHVSGDNDYFISTNGTKRFCLHSSGACFYNISGTASSPVLGLSNTASSTYIHSVEAFSPNMTSGQANISVIGKSATTKNSGYIGYYWSADASNSNFVSIGHWSSDHRFRVYADGMTCATCNLSVGTCVSFCGSTIKTGTCGPGRQVCLVSSCTGSTGLEMYDSGGNFKWSVYGTGNAFGFLTSQWGQWGLQYNCTDQKLYLNNNSTYYLAPNSTSYLNHLTVAGNTWIDSSISIRDSDCGIYFNRYNTSASSDYSNYIKAGCYPSQGYSAGSNYWLEYGTKGGHHFVVNTDGGAGSGEVAMDDFTIWQGCVDGDRLFSVSNVGNTCVEGRLCIASAGASGGNIKFTGTPNPYICASSFIYMPGGLYVNGGYGYFSNRTLHRGGICNDSGAWLTIYGGTAGDTSFDGNVGIGTTDPGANLHIRAATGSDTPGDINSHVMFDVADDGGPAWGIRLGDTGDDGDFNIDRRTGGSWSNVIKLDRTAGHTTVCGRLYNKCAAFFGPEVIDPDSFGSCAGGFGNIADGSGWGARGVFVHGGGTGDAAAIAHNGNCLFFGIQNGSAANSMATWMSVAPNCGKTIYGTTTICGTTNICSCLCSGDVYICSSTNSWNGGLQMLSQDGTDLYCIHPDNNGYMYVNKNWCFNDGDLKFGKSNPYLCAPSYIVMPGGLYVNGGHGYFSNRTFHRGGICNDSGAWLRITGGTAGDTSFGGNVGIGTTDPIHALHVVGQSLFANNGSNINISNTWSSGNHDINFIGGSTSGGSANNTAARIRSVATAPGGAAVGDLLFTVNCGDSFVDALYIEETGQVGIGTTGPSAKLDVCGTGTVFSVNGTNGTLFSVEDDLSDSLMSVNDAAGLPVLEVFADSSVCAGRYGCSDFYIACDGAVGIGTTDASTVNAPNNGGNGGVTKLHVVGAPRTTTFSASDGTTWHDVVVRNPTNSSANLSVGLAFELHNDYHENAGTGIAAIKSAAGDYGAHLAFITRPTSAVAQERMRITCDGNVGIGTTDPGSCKLVAAGDIKSCDGWFRTTGARGWYNDTYGGGIYMCDSSWVRVYNDKNIYTGGSIHMGGGLCVAGNSCLGNGNGDWVHVNDKLHIGATDSGDACLQFGEGATANLSWGVDWNWDSAYTFAWHARCSGTNRNLVWGYNVSTNDYVCTGRCINMCNNSIHEINELAFTDSFRICDTGQSNKIFFCSGCSTNVRLELGSQTTGRGSLYANNGNCIGILDEGGDWAIIHKNDAFTAFRDSGGTERLCIGTTQIKSNEPFCINANWSDGTHAEQLTIQGSHPSIALRSTNAGTSGNVNLIHVNGDGNLDFYSTPCNSGVGGASWTKRACISIGGNIWAQTALYAGSSGALRQVTGNYGSIEVDGGATGGWEGYSIGGRIVFMHDNSCGSGIFNDVDNEWLFYGHGNADTRMYYDGTARIFTTVCGACINQGSGYGLEINGSENGKIVLSGATDPYIRFREGTIDKAYLQWNGTSGDFIISNNEDNRRIHLNTDLCFFNGTGCCTVWHAGNDGSGSGLDADLLDGQDCSYYRNASNLNAGTYPDLFSCTTRYNIGLIDGGNSNTRDKLRVWNSFYYSIGMCYPWTYGALNYDYAMTFQMNSDNDRGFWWGDTSHTSAQGAMSLTTHGYLTVASRIKVGGGESDTSGPYYPLHVSGTSYLDGLVYTPSNVIHTGDTDTYYGFHGANHWRVVTGGSERIEIRDAETVINDSALNHDFRVETQVPGYLGDDNYALFVDASQGAVGIGTSQPSYALEVNGTAFVTGTFSAGTKNFLIDHPTKENYMLRHGSLEGPENAVYVRGTTTSSSIELPEYWTGLVDEDTITATLTPRGKYLQLFLDRVEDNEIHVGGTEIGELYDYVIYGTRKDVEDLIVEFERPVGS